MTTSMLAIINSAMAEERIFFRLLRVTAIVAYELAIVATV